MTLLLRGFVFLTVLLSVAGCRKGGCNVVDEVVFNQGFFRGEYPYLFIEGGVAVSNTGGVAGLIVVHRNGQYIAYDRCSTVNPEKRCAVEVDGSGLIAIDPCTKAKWILTNGSPADIAECPLKPYRTRIQGDVIYVYN